MSFKYNILWLDDEPIKALETIRLANPSVSFEQVNYVDMCEMILKEEPEKYHAVILDANGVKSDSPDKDANKSGFLPLVHLVKEKRIPLYIYSGQLLRASDGDTADVVLEELKRIGLQEEKTIFYKSGGPYKMIDQIIGDLDSKYHYYVGHEYLLDFFTKGWIDKKFKSEFLDNIMDYYYNKDYDSAHGNHMRNMTEQMLLVINKVFNLATNIKEGDPSFYANIAKTIKNKKLDYSEAISGPLLHMIELSNARSHNALPDEVRKLYFDSDFSTFFIVTNWFNIIMSRIEQGETNSEEEDKHIEVQQVVTKQEKDTNRVSTPPRPQTHENNRSGVVVQTYKEKGRTYCDLKVEIPWKWKDYSKLLITGIKPNIDPTKATWYPYCQEVPKEP